MYGYDSAFIGGTLTLPSFETKFGLDSKTDADLSSKIVSTFQAGAFFGGLFGYGIAEVFGRRAVLYVTALVFIAGVILQLIGNISLFYAGRALTGLGVGAACMDIPIYIGECSPAGIRGRLVGIFECMLQVCLVFGFWVNYGVNLDISSKSDEQWRIPVAIQFIPVGLLVISLALFTVESPRWLLSKGKKEAATKSLTWLRNLPAEHPYIRYELSQMELGIFREVEAGEGKNIHLSIARELCGRGVRNRLFLGCALMLLQNLTGYVSI
jgi:MFS family permease